jgi:hypothetical protein
MVADQEEVAPGATEYPVISGAAGDLTGEGSVVTDEKEVAARAGVRAAQAARRPSARMLGSASSLGVAAYADGGRA